MSTHLGYNSFALNRDLMTMNKKINFEQSLKNLEDIVQQLEKGDLSLDESLKQYEKGIKLARECQGILSEAEQKIEMLSIDSAAAQTDTPEK